MGPTGVSNDRSLDITEPEIEAGACLIQEPDRLESRPTDPAPPPLPPAVKTLVDKHTATAAPPKDWCGSQGTEWVSEGAFGVNWSEACKTRDECYGTLGANKFLCDYSLQQDISLACAAQDGGDTCQFVAGVYYDAVHLFGGNAYERAQADATKAGQ